MDKSIVDQINEFCDHNVGTSVERYFVINKFIESYYDSIDERTDRKGKTLSKEEVDSILMSFLNKNTLISFADSAKAFNETLKENIKNDYKKSLPEFSYPKTIWAGIITNFIYSILLIISFFIGKSQISSWLSQLIEK